MKYTIMKDSDIEKVIPLYINYYNNYENSCWTYETTYKRINQIWCRESSYCLILEDNGVLIGFAVGYFEQYDDLVAYNLDEILIDHTYQKKGIGTKFMLELEQQIKNKGAAMIQLKAVNDEMHEHFYEKLLYKDAKNFVLKSKFL